MKQKLLSIIVSVISFSLVPSLLSAQVKIPIVGADESLSQYICVTTPGVKTVGMKMIRSNGTVQNISVKNAKAKVTDQIQTLTKKILNVSDLLKAATKERERNKLKDKLKSLRTQRDLLKYIKSQITLCEKAKLIFNASNIPVLLTNTVTLPDFSEPVNLFKYGFKFTIPKNYVGQKYCVAVSHATRTPFGGIIYPDPGEMEVEAFKNCTPFGAPIGNLCVNGLEADEGMIILVQGAILERVGDCTSTSHCSLNELKNYLPSFYAGARLTSFKPGTCD